MDLDGFNISPQEMFSDLLVMVRRMFLLVLFEFLIAELITKVDLNLITSICETSCENDVNNRNQYVVLI